MKKFVGVIICGVIILLVYLLYNPESCAWFPKCAFMQLTGLECPSCGAQRALHSFLNGDIIKAIEYNPFLVIALPFFLAVVYAKWFDTNSAKKIGRYVLHRYSIYAYISAYFSWWIIRNL